MKMRVKGIFLVISVALWITPAAVANHSITELVSTGPAGGNGAVDATRAFAMSPDGSHAFFSTAESLVPEDTDGQVDVYQRVGGLTSLVSTGPAGGNGPFPASPLFGSLNDPASYRPTGMTPDGSHVLFTTAEQLVSEDTDNRSDIYERFGNTTRLVSTGPTGGDPRISNGSPVAISDDGALIFFTSYERLTADDTNDDPDVYLRTGGNTRLISSGPPTLSGFERSLSLIGASPDGQRVVFETNRQLDPRDADGGFDVYQWSGGSPEIVSIGPNGENSGVTTFNGAMNRDGSHIFWASYGALVPEDTNGSEDLYEHTGGTTRLVSVGVGSYGGFLTGFSADGTRVFFETQAPLAPDDTNAWYDIYERANGTTTLLSRGTDSAGASWRAGSADGSHVFFVSHAALTPEDTDGRYSMYEWSAGAITYVAPWVSPPHNLSVALSTDGARLFVDSIGPLVGSDADTGCTEGTLLGPPGCADVYERFAGAWTLISTGPATVNGTYSVCEVQFLVSNPFFFVFCPIAISADGTHVLFRTRERLTADDTDDLLDVYESSVASTEPRRSDYKNAAKFCQAERDYLGAAAFAERYGTNGNRANAFGRCVSSS
jgi:Tol biopolymer transport system component